MPNDVIQGQAYGDTHTTPYAMEEEKEIDLMGLFYHLWDRKKLIIIVTLVFALLASGVSLFKMLAPDLVDDMNTDDIYYHASANIYISEPSGQYILNRLKQESNLAIADFRELIYTAELRQQVIENLELSYDNTLLNSMMSIGTPSSRMLSVNVTIDNEDEAIQIANEYARLACDHIVAVQDTPRTVIQYDATTAMRVLTIDEQDAIKEGTKLKEYYKEQGLELDGSEPRNFSKKIVVIGAFFGMIMIVGILALLFIISDRVRAQDDLEKLTGGEMLASIPKNKNDVAKGKIDKTHLPTLARVEAEAISTLCTKLTFMDPAIKRVLITGAQEGEGTSFVAVNMVHTLTKMGKRVVLVDADMQKSTLIADCKMQIKTKGLSEFILDEKVTAQDVLANFGTEGAAIVPCGSRVEQPVQMLMSDRFTMLLNELAEQYDYVLVDSQPLGYVMDAAIIARVCDGVLIVVGDGNTTKREIKAATDRLPRAECRVIGSVFTKVDMQTSYNKYYFPSKESANAYY